MDEEADIKAQITKALDELAERNESPLPKQTDSVTDITAKVEGHLKKMRLAWK